MIPDVVMTAIGGGAITDAIGSSAALLGYEASRTEPPTGNVEFVDYPFTMDGTTAERIDALERAVRRHSPKIAVAPDVEGDVSLERAVDVGDRLLDAGADVVVITPKDVEPYRVPERFRVGYTAATFGGSGAGWPMTAYRGLDDSQGVHVLGGSPTDQLELANYGVPVESVDGSAVEKAAKHYDIWTPDRPHWVHAGDHSDLYHRVRVSLDNVAKAWADRRGLTHPEVARTVTAEDVKREEQAVVSEVRRRQAGRGPPLADPDGDGGAIEAATIDTQANTRLNERDEMVRSVLAAEVETDDQEDDEADPETVETAAETPATGSLESWI